MKMNHQEKDRNMWPASNQLQDQETITWFLSLADIGCGIQSLLPMSQNLQGQKE